MGLAISSNRSSTHAATIWRGGPPLEIGAETRTLGSTTARTRRYAALGATLLAHRVHLVIGELECFVAIQLIAGFTRLAIECAQNTLTTTDQLQVALVGQDNGLGSPVRADDHRLGVRAGAAKALEQRRELHARLARGQHVMSLRTTSGRRFGPLLDP